MNTKYPIQDLLLKLTIFINNTTSPTDPLRLEWRELRIGIERLVELYDRRELDEYDHVLRAVAALLHLRMRL